MNYLTEPTEHQAASDKIIREFRQRFEAKCPTIASDSSHYKIKYSASPAEFMHWIPVIDFEQPLVPELRLRLEGNRWWLTSRATIQEGKNLFEIQDSEPDFEAKIRVQIERALNERI